MAHIVEEIAKENSTYRLTGTFKDEADVAIPAANLFTVKMWLHDQNGAVINSRSGVNILNAGPGTIDANGNLVLILDPADNPIVDATQSCELHVLTIEWTWNAGVRKSHEELQLRVENLKHVPTS